MPLKAIIYTEPNSQACDQVKGWFARRGIPFEERNVMLNLQARQELRDLGGGTLPVTLLHGEPIRGFDPERFEALVGPGIGT